MESAKGQNFLAEQEINKIRSCIRPTLLTNIPKAEDISQVIEAFLKHDTLLQESYPLIWRKILEVIEVCGSDNQYHSIYQQYKTKILKKEVPDMDWVVIFSQELPVSQPS